MHATMDSDQSFVEYEITCERSIKTVTSISSLAKSGLGLSPGLSYMYVGVHLIDASIDAHHGDDPRAVSHGERILHGTDPMISVL